MVRWAIAYSDRWYPFIGTYSSAKNAWTFNRVQAGEYVRLPIVSATEPTTNPNYEAPDNALVVGDIWYDTSGDSVVKKIYDGSSWTVMAQGGLQTTATLPLGLGINLLSRRP